MVSPQNGCFILENPNYFFKGTIAKVFPKGARTFKIVSSCGLVIPFSILAITGCLTLPIFFVKSLFLPCFDKFTNKGHTQITFNPFFRC